MMYSKGFWLAHVTCGFTHLPKLHLRLLEVVGVM